jgi:uncharacterized Tic20 family protein
LARALSAGQLEAADSDARGRPSNGGQPGAYSVLAMEEKETRQWCMFMHLSQFAGYIVPIGGIVVPIVMWQLKKDQAPEVDAHGRMIVNALISYFIYIAIALVLCLVLIGFVLLWVIGLLALIFPIIGAVEASNGRLWKYPGVFEFI